MRKGELMKKIIKNLSICFGFLALLLCGFYLSSCCSPSPKEVTVTFKGADSRLGLKDYKYYVDFSDSTKVSFDVPKGYDHTAITGSISGVQVDYSVKYKDESSLEEGYEYASEKTITFNIEFVKRDFELVIDLSEMQKLTFDITLDSSMKNFKAVTIKEDLVDGFMTKVTSEDILDTVDFVNGKATIEYGNYVILNYNKSSANGVYDAIYSDINHYTLAKNKANIGTINYSYYNRAKKGNVDYVMEGFSNWALYYIGEIKEDVNFYSAIPNYVPDKGFDIDRKQNTFYLFTNMDKYNSDMLTINAYTSTNKTYDSSNTNLDIIDGNVVEKVNASSVYNKRYNVYNIYIGQNLQSDIFLTEKDKENINNDLYFVVSSSIGLENINFNLLENQYQNVQWDNNGYKLQVSKNKTERGNNYIKITEEDLNAFSLERDYVYPDGDVTNYKTGMAILYPELSYEFFSDTKGKSYMRLFKDVQIITEDAQIDANDLQVSLYIADDDGSNKKYGLPDDHFWPNRSWQIDCDYFKISDLYDYDDGTKEYMYKNNLYMCIEGYDYENFASPLIEGFYIIIDNISRTEVKVLDAKSYNGYDKYLITGLPFNHLNLGELTITIKVMLRQTYKNATTLDFSYCDLPADYSQGIYITDNALFESIDDFYFVHGGVKDTFNTLEFSMSKDLYYFVRSDSDFDFEIRLDPNDPTTKISISQDYLDIKGDKISMKINGIPYKIKVIKQDIIYELLNEKMYVVKA